MTFSNPSHLGIAVNMLPWTQWTSEPEHYLSISLHWTIERGPSTVPECSVRGALVIIQSNVWKLRARSSNGFSDWQTVPAGLQERQSNTPLSGSIIIKNTFCGHLERERERERWIVDDGGTLNSKAVLDGLWIIHEFKFTSWEEGNNNFGKHEEKSVQTPPPPPPTQKKKKKQK